MRFLIEHFAFQIGYEGSFSKHIGSRSNAEKYINQMINHMQAYFCHASLGTHLKLEVSCFHASFVMIFVSIVTILESIEQVIENTLIFATWP